MQVSSYSCRVWAFGAAKYEYGGFAIIVENILN